MNERDEFVSCEYYGDDYTIKIYEREDCKYYATLLYESDDEARLIYTSKAQSDAAKAKALAVERARRHRLEVNRK